MEFAKRCSINGCHLWTLVEDIAIHMISDRVFKNTIVKNIHSQDITKAYAIKYNYPYTQTIITSTVKVTTKKSSRRNTYQHALTSSTNPSSQTKTNPNNNTTADLTFWSIEYSLYYLPVGLLLCYTLYNELYIISKPSISN